jgi:thiol-disulfide isomerase/thioredoxin
MNNQVKIFVSVICILILGTIAAVLLQSKSTPSAPGKYDALAQCITNSGATFYGAFWCPHCQAEKALFGSSVHLLPYVECSTPDANGQTQICIDKKITSYPTWVFKDGSTLTGTIPLAQLATKTGCTVPQ